VVVDGVPTSVETGMCGPLGVRLIDRVEGLCIDANAWQPSCEINRQTRL
jgi:hypothetical protein